MIYVRGGRGAPVHRYHRGPGGRRPVRAGRVQPRRSDLAERWSEVAGLEWGEGRGPCQTGCPPRAAGGGLRMSGRTVPDAERLLTPAEVAAMFRVDPKTVTRWARDGRLTAVRTLGGHRRYRETEVLCPAQRRQRPAPECIELACGRSGELPADARLDPRVAGRLPVPRRARPGRLRRQGQEPAVAAELLLRRLRQPASAHPVDAARRCRESTGPSSAPRSRRSSSSTPGSRSSTRGSTSGTATTRAIRTWPC